MRPENWMDDAFGSKAKIRLLRLLARDRQRTWTEREAAEALAMSPNTINLAAKELRNTGLIDFHKVGKSHGIRLRPDLKLSQALLSIFDQEARLGQEVEDAVRAAIPAGVACYLYGSTARGTPTAESDVDLLIVAKTQDDAAEVAASVRSAVAAVMPAPLEILALDRATVWRRRKSRLLTTIQAEGRQLSSTPLEAVA